MVTCKICGKSLGRLAKDKVRCEGDEHHFFIEELEVNPGAPKEQCRLILIDKSTGKPTDECYTVPCADLRDIPWI